MKKCRINRNSAANSIKMNYLRNLLLNVIDLLSVGLSVTILFNYKNFKDKSVMSISLRLLITSQWFGFDVC